MAGRETDCVKHVYPLCEEGSTRNQLGNCLNPDQWRTYCQNEVSSQLLLQFFSISDIFAEFDLNICDFNV